MNGGYSQFYDDGEISFNYPSNWELETGTNPSQVVLFQPGTNSNISINKQAMPDGYKSPEDYILNNSKTYKSGFRLLSHEVKTIDTNTAYENTYYINNSKGVSYLQKEVWIEKNGTLYSIIYTLQDPLPENSFNTEMIGIYPDGNIYHDGNGTDSSSNQNYIDPVSALEEMGIYHGFKTVVENFDIKSVQNPAKTVFWGDVSIPTLNVDWKIRSDGVNGYNLVYHYNESFYPSQNGTVGLLGHRTSYSAPFRNIDKLKPGDEVIINDYLTQRKYIYKVVTNGDINWDYKNNPITFPEGISDLYLVTCHPPGTIKAAWIVHCKLSSIEIL